MKGLKGILLGLVWLLNLQLPAQTPEDRLTQLGFTLPPASPPVATYVNVVRTGNLLFLAGKGPGLPEGGWITGKVGQGLTVEQGYEAAMRVALAHIAVLKEELGDLSKVKRIVKVLAMVNATPEFDQHPSVTNGYSDFMFSIFGDKGRHARSSVGMCSLPYNIAVEVEVVVEIED
jgi:enamine deaminase RidA (YjgF/YER057c/UK114 family)